MQAKFLISICVILLIPHEIQPAKILSVAFFSSRSHKITYEPLLYELAARGHQVTVLGPFISGKSTPNLREILTIDSDAAMEAMPNLFEMKERGQQLNPMDMITFIGKLCSETYDLPQVQELAREKFDLVIGSAIFNECTSGFIHKLNASLVLISPMSPPGWVASSFGSPTPPSFVPNLFTDYDDTMTFYQRTMNILVEAAIRVIRSAYFVPAMTSLYRDKLNDQFIPSHDEIVRNASLILANSHFSLSKARPYLPDIVEVGGMHCRPAKPLPKDLEDFANSSGSDGFILFSMGSALKAIKMPEKYRQVFIKTFAKLKQKVLWKWETEEMADLPSNVKLSKWLPQQDVLGHPKIKAFLTHGGFGGTTEAVYHGVPLVGIPMFGDQLLNMKKSVASGFAVSLDFATLNEEELLAAINRVVSESAFRERVQDISKIFRNQPENPLDRAVFWTEYVLKHKGAVHLRSAARDLNFLQYHSIDVVLTLISLILLTLYVLFAVLRFIIRKTCCTRKNDTNKLLGTKKRN